MTESVLDLKMPFLAFTVPAVPIATPRPRAITIAGHAAMVPAPKKHAIHDFKASVRDALQQNYDGAPLDCAIGMRILFVMPRPKNRIWKTKPMPREWYTASCNDWDNLGKGVSDAMNKLLYRDDGCLADVSVKRVVASGYERPHVEIEVELLGGVAQ